MFLPTRRKEKVDNGTFNRGSPEENKNKNKIDWSTQNL